MTDPNLDEIFRLLSDQKRRQIIRLLRKTPDVEVGFEELINGIIEKTSPKDEQRDQIIIQLHHHHLPQLHEHGLIDYDSDAKLVRYLPDRQIETVMDSILAKQSPAVSDD